MDLTLELGFSTVAELRRKMTERELGQWATYARRYFLPRRRMELLLANIARLSASGGDLASFCFDPRTREMLEPKPARGQGVEGAAAAMSGIFGGARIVHLGAVPIGQERRAANG